VLGPQRDNDFEGIVSFYKYFIPNGIENMDSFFEQFNSRE